MRQVDYFDSSALVKRYFVETGSDWVVARYRRPGGLIATAEVSRVEIAAAFAAKLRGNHVTSAAYQHARSQLAVDSKKRYHLLPVTSARIDEAIELTAQHKLRGYDAIHLACALNLNQALLADQLLPLTFVTADVDLLAAVQSAGIPTINLNDQP